MAERLPVPSSVSNAQASQDMGSHTLYFDGVWRVFRLDRGLMAL